MSIIVAFLLAWGTRYAVCARDLSSGNQVSFAVGQTNAGNKARGESREPVEVTTSTGSLFIADWKMVQ